MHSISSPSDLVFGTPPATLLDAELRVAARRLRLTARLDELLCLSHLCGAERIGCQLQAVLPVLQRPPGWALLAEQRAVLAWPGWPECVDDYLPCIGEEA